MDWLDKMNGAIGYIEDHLLDEIDYWEVARKAACSEYHFRRMFPFMAGIPLSEYIRRRRLTLAANELNHRDMPVSDIAKKYGYSSPDAFTRSFKNWHGITPSDVQKGGQSIKAFPKMVFHVSIKGGTEMKYRIIKKDAFKIVGIMKRVPILFEGENSAIAEMWKSLDKNTLQKLKTISDMEPKGILQASTNFSEARMEEKGGLDHYIGVATAHQKGDEFSVLNVPASAWAVFELENSTTQNIQNTWGRIFSEWFPESGYELSEGPEILWKKEMENPSTDQRSEIWIPVIKK